MIDERKLILHLNDWMLQESYLRQLKNPADIICECIETVEEQPKIGRWIPCSERLPEIMKPVLVCDKQGNVCVRTVTCELKGKKYWSQDKYDIVAWQPLPEPYRQ